TGTGIEGRMPMVAAMPMSRSSGIARFAAVPGVLSFVFIWFGKGWKRYLWIIPLLFFGWIIYIMQSRGAVIGFCFVIAFEMLFLGGRKRTIAIFFLLLFGVALVSNAIPGKLFEDVSSYMRRGQSVEEFRSMTGRTYYWKLAWPKILEAPIVGRGFQADRSVAKGHVHNTYLYVLLTAGFTGGLVFVVGLVWSWLLFFLALKKSDSFDPKHKIFLIQAGGILAFFTIRGITEVSGGLFNVDFMVMLPIMTYLGALDQRYSLTKKLKVVW
ncbi:MAG TPA: O-antigen ligase family protein, partial [Thermodesulfovibrionales bacterium]|nr:O-antigen ligase family protein [Thermodesulfovibrionales bacterium]